VFRRLPRQSQPLPSTVLRPFLSSAFKSSSFTPSFSRGPLSRRRSIRFSPQHPGTYRHGCDIGRMRTMEWPRYSDKGLSSINTGPPPPRTSLQHFFPGNRERPHNPCRPPERRECESCRSTPVRAGLGGERLTARAMAYWLFSSLTKITGNCQSFRHVESLLENLPLIGSPSPK